MDNFLDQLAAVDDADATSDVPSPRLVADDIARGRTALRRRRQRAGGVLSVAALVLAGSVGYLAASDGSSGARHPVAAPTVALVDSGNVNGLVNDGSPTPGFTVPQVPDKPGWIIESRSAEWLMGPPLVVNSDSAAAEQLAETDSLQITAQADQDVSAANTTGQTVTIDGHQGFFWEAQGSPGTPPSMSVEYEYSPGTWIRAQCGTGVGLTQDQFVQFLGAVTTTPQLQLSAG